MTKTPPEPSEPSEQPAQPVPSVPAVPAVPAMPAVPAVPAVRAEQSASGAQSVVAPNPFAEQPYGATVVFGPQPPRGLSTASMILGIVGVVAFAAGGGLLSVLAVVFGHIGLRKEPSGRGMAIAGLVTGYVGIGFTAILIAFLVVIPLILIAIAGTVAVGTSGLSS